MFKDKNEELRRLEAELLLEEQREEAQRALEAELEEDDILLDAPEDYGEETEQTYYNYSNRYGKIRAYNADHTDQDPEEYSRSLQQQDGRSLRPLVILAICLLAAVAAVLGWCVLRFKGIVP